MAEDKKVVVSIKSTFDDKGTKAAEKAYKNLEAEADKTNKNIARGAEESKIKLTDAVSGISGIASAWGSIQSVIGWFGECVWAAAENARAVNMLAGAYQNVGYTATGAMQQAQDFATKMQSLTGMGDEVFLDAQRQLANVNVVGVQAQEAVQAAYALSASQGMSFESALQLVARAAAGSADALSNYGIVLGDNVKDGEKLDAVLSQINEKFGASAQAAMGNTASQVSALKERWGDLREEIGDNLIPVLENLVNVGNKAMDMWNRLFNKDRTVDQIAYEKNLEKIAEIQKKIHNLDSAKETSGKAYNQNVYEKRRADLEKELNFYKSAQQALEKQNYQRALAAKKEEEIRDRQAEQINTKNKIGRLTQEEAKAKAQEAEAEKKAKEEKEKRRVRQVLNDAGVGPKQSTSGWDTSSDQQEAPMSMASMLTGTDLDETSRFFENIDQQKAGLKELYDEKLKLLQQGQLDEETYAKAKVELDTQFAVQGAELDMQVAKKRQATMKTALDNLASLQNSSNAKMAAVGKATATAQATIETYKSAVSAYSAMAGIPVIGPVLGAAAAAAAIAFGLNQVAQINSIKLADGGLIKAVTGGVPALIGEGGSDEAVLPLDNARAIRRIGGAIADESGGLGGGTTINVNINASGGLLPFLDELTTATQNGVTEALRYANVAVKAGRAQGGLSV